ncbi:hypothetical protein GCM10025771_26230 [Niveibacterium umoris]|uniref:Co-chaperone DjlA N-terminal domain-containing protein n=1 Tax=Niveibacterium umoris TaxID=1193620 RepID=A0A840BKU2_9RHOO|nr:TerB family tellurite resistance protein [Niveibacterium umoris]MBB4012188.1 hypothetical protein [Niveibacterium umoris]
MRSYPVNSPEAAARLICMAILADGRLHDREVALLDQHMIPDAVGITKDTLVQVLLDCCRDLVDEAEQSRVHLLENARIDRLAADITRPELRRTVCSAILVMAKADGQVTVGEQRLLLQLMERWGLSLDTLAG